MDWIQIILTAIAIIIGIILLFRKSGGGVTREEMQTALSHTRADINSDTQAQLSQMRGEISRANTDNITLITTQLSQMRGEIMRANTENSTALSASLTSGMTESFRQQQVLLKTALEAVAVQLAQFEKRLSGFQTENSQNLQNIRTTVETSLAAMREDNNKKLDEMRQTVDEKLQTELQKRMHESFRQVSELMERLQKDIGSMKTLADDVGGLKKSLTNVKTRGMMGEFQLENILRDVMPGQYEKNVHTNPDNRTQVVEFAVRIPTEDDSFIYLPIDSKFPQDKYQAVLDAQESGDRAQTERAVAMYVSELKRCADEITKYIAPPFTTEYALMFLPTESMYADAVNHGMLEELWKRSKVYVTGPSTVAALLGSMQLSFNNLAIKKRAAEVFTVLTEISLEFDKFAGVLEKMQTHLNQTDKDLTDLLGTRTRAMQRKLGGLKRLALDDGASPALTDSDE